MLRKRSASVPFLFECRSSPFWLRAVFHVGTFQAKIELNHASQRWADFGELRGKTFDRERFKSDGECSGESWPGRISLRNLSTSRPLLFRRKAVMFRAANASNVEPPPGLSGRYNLHSPEATRRPPPCFLLMDCAEVGILLHFGLRLARSRSRKSADRQPRGIRS